MRRQKLKARNIDTDNANRTAAASSFKKGDRIRYVATGQEGAFLEVHDGFAAPECWVQFDDCSIPVSVNPLQLELVFQVGDRISVAAWGHQKGEVVSIKPLLVWFDGRNKESRITQRDIEQGIEICDRHLEYVVSSQELEDAQSKSEPIVDSAIDSPELDLNFAGIINNIDTSNSNEAAQSLPAVRQGVQVLQPNPEILQSQVQGLKSDSRDRRRESDRSLRVGDDSIRGSAEDRSKSEGNPGCIQKSGIQVSESRQKESVGREQLFMEGRSKNSNGLHHDLLPKPPQSEREQRLCNATHLDNGALLGQIPGVLRSGRSEERDSSSHQSQQAGQHNRELAIDDRERTHNLAQQPAEKELNQCNNNTEFFQPLLEWGDGSRDASLQDSITSSESSNLSKSQTTPDESCSDDSPESPFTMMCEPLTQSQEALISSAPRHHAKASPKQDSAEPEKTSEICFPNSSDCFAEFDQNGRLLKTYQDCLQLQIDNTFEEFSGSFPSAGMMCNGRLYHAQKWVDSTNENESGLLLPTPKAQDGEHPGVKAYKQGQTLHLSAAVQNLPTPTASDWKTPRKPTKGGRSLNWEVQNLPTPVARDWKDGSAAQVDKERSEQLNDRMAAMTGKRKLSVPFVERMMGFPEGWTQVEQTTSSDTPTSPNGLSEQQTQTISPAEKNDCKPSEMPLPQIKLRSLGEESLISLDSDYGKMEELVPGRSLATDAGAEITAMDTSAMDNSTMSSTADAAKNFPPAQLAPLKVLEELTLDEERDRHHLELKVERAFYEAGKALAEIRDRRLYRSTHKTFEEYCRNRFGYTRRNVNYTIAAAAVVENLCTNSTQNGQEDLGKNLSQNGQEDLGTIGSQILPTNERQVRDLIGLEPDEQRQVWEEAVEEAGGKVPSGRVVKGIVERLKEKPLVLASEYCNVGDIFRLQRLTGSDNKFNGWWGIALEVENRFTVQCQVCDKILDIKQENIKWVDMTKEELEIQQKVIERVSRLARCNLDPVVWSMLEVLNRQVYFTDVQMKFLETAEQIYGIRESVN